MSAGPAGCLGGNRAILGLHTMVRLGQAIVNIYGHTTVPTSRLPGPATSADLGWLGVSSYDPGRSRVRTAAAHGWVLICPDMMVRSEQPAAGDTRLAGLLRTR
jgi:hypothetical protein